MASLLAKTTMEPIVTAHSYIDNDFEWGPRSMDTKNNNNNNSGKKEEEEKKEENPFQRSSKVTRSPSGQQGNSQRRESTSEPQQLSNKRRDEQATPTSSKTPERTTKLTQVKKVVDELYEFAKDKNNVHHQIKRLILKIKGLVLEAVSEVETRERKTHTVEDSLAKTKNVVRGKGKEREQGTPMSNKRFRTPETTPLSKAKKIRGNNITEIINTKEQQGKCNEWTKVGKKPRKEKGDKNRIRERPEALIVGVTGQKSYADILRSVKTDPKLIELGKRVTKIRRTLKGEMLFELSKDPDSKCNDFKKLMEESLGEEAKVRSLTQEITIECRNIDEISTEEELRSALKERYQIDKQEGHIRLRPTYGKTQIAEIKLPVKSANRLLEIGKVKVGWTVCTMKLQKQPKRCFKCMDFGHWAKDCKGTDRSKLCRRCGEEGHQAKSCSNPPKCLLCKNATENAHITGGSRCPIFRRAIQNA